jgi:cation diffusion facilitator CzcD-associated flavoprotein CzcO
MGLFAKEQNMSQISQKRLDSSIPTSHDTAIPHVRIAIVGAGLSGLGMAIQLKQSGITDFTILERASDVGGTWRDNTYPGCACDVQSHLYSFSFALNPNWSHAYAPQSEILDYLHDCVVRFKLNAFIKWNSTLLDATWDDTTQQWFLETEQGPLTAQFLILGQGPLSAPATPAIPGIDTFQGTIFHSATWNHKHSLQGKRVAVIGTGASAIQIIPQIQQLANHLTLFQRTPAWIMPRHDHPIPIWQRSLFRAMPFTQRIARSAIYWMREITGLAMVYQPKILQRAQNAALTHLNNQVRDPELRAKLVPSFTMGCKRILLSDDFYPAITQPNITLETQRIREIHDHSIVTDDGNEHSVDTIILCTGFHVVDAPIASLINGRGGKTLSQHWSSRQQAYLGTTVAGFPNLFLMLGPNTGLGHTSMIYMIESQVKYILDCLKAMQRQQIQAVEIQPDIQASFNEKLQQKMRHTVWMTGCKSWYLDANGHNTILWPGFTVEYRQKTRRFDMQHYKQAKSHQHIPATVS